MQRRSALKSLSIGFGGLISMPAWAINWDKKTLGKNIYLADNEGAILSEIVETIIPETKTPGAKSLGVDKLIQKLVGDCQGKEALTKLNAGILAIEAEAKAKTSKSYLELNASERLDFVKTLANSANKEASNAYSKIRRMTIEGYMGSEHYMTTIGKYEWAPARFHGCVPIGK